MMVNIKVKGLKISMKTIGMFLTFIYVFMSYNAKNVFIPSYWNSIALYVFLGFGIIYLLVAEKGMLTLTTYSIWYLIFMLLSLLCMLYSPEFSIISGQFYLMIVSFCLTFIFQMYIKEEKSFYALGWFYAFAAAFLIISLIVTGKLSSMSSERLGESLTGNANSFACMIMVVVFYELWMMIYGYKKITIRLLLASLILLNMYALSLSGGRSAFIVPFVFLYSLLIFKRDKSDRVHFIRYTILMVAIVFAAYWAIMNIPALYEGVGYRMEIYINSLLGINKADYSAKVRALMREMAIKEWLKSPVWGYGFNSFKYFAQVTIGHFYYSHCNYTELLYCGGFIYFVAYYWIYYKIFKETFIKKVSNMKYKAFALASVFSLLVYDYSIISYSISFTQMILALSLAVLKFQLSDEK